MSDFQTEATVSVVLDSNSVTNVKSELEQELGPVDVMADGSNLSTQAGATSMTDGGGGTRMESQLLDTAESHLEVAETQLEAVLDIQDALVGGGGVGGGGLFDSIIPDLGALSGGLGLASGGALALSAASVLSVSGTLALAATGVLAVTGTIDLTVADIITTTGTLTVGIASVLAIAGTLALSAPAVLAVVGTVGLAAASVLAVSGTMKLNVSNILSVTGVTTIAAAAALAVTGTVSLPAAGVIAVVGTVTLAASELIDFRGLYENRPTFDMDGPVPRRQTLRPGASEMTTPPDNRIKDGQTINGEPVITGDQPTTPADRRSVDLGNGQSVNVTVNDNVTIDASSLDQLERDMERRDRQRREDIIREFERRQSRGGR